MERAAREDDEVRGGGGRDDVVVTVGDDLEGRLHEPGGDPRAAGEEGGGARGQASKGGLGDVGAAGWGRCRSEFGEGGNLLGGWLG